MALIFWTALFAWTGCFVATLLISLLTKRTKTDDELRGLVHSLTPRQRDGDMPWYKRPVTLAVAILVVSTLLNVIFWLGRDETGRALADRWDVLDLRRD